MNELLARAAGRCRLIYGSSISIRRPLWGGGRVFARLPGMAAAAAAETAYQWQTIRRKPPDALPTRNAGLTDVRPRVFVTPGATNGLSGVGGLPGIQVERHRAGARLLGGEPCGEPEPSLRA